MRTAKCRRRPGSTAALFPHLLAPTCWNGRSGPSPADLRSRPTTQRTLELLRPEGLIAELREPLLVPEEADRDGYVPNVVYSCGGLLHAGAVWMPYGVSDCRIGFAVVPLDTLLAAMTPVPAS